MKESEVIELLKQYPVCKRFIDSQAYAKEYFNPYGTQKIEEKELCEYFAYAADVVPKSEEGAECPTCHGTGRIGTTDWLTKNISKKQLAEEKAKAIAEHEQYIKTEVAREIFEEIESVCLKHIDRYDRYLMCCKEFAELKKKYTEEKEQ